MLYGCERMHLEYKRLIKLETLIRFYQAGSPVQFYG